MKFAVIGKGFIYPRHKQAIERVGGEVIMTCDNDPKKGADYLDWVEMLNSGRFEYEVDAVSICTPNYLHGVMVRECLLRGKKVICEKPFTIDTTEGMNGAISILQLRKHPALKKLKKADIYVEAKMFRDDVYWDSWKGQTEKSGGILFNLGVHYIDLMVYLLGRPDEILEAEVTETVAKGKVRFGDHVGEFHIEIVDNREEQGRNILVGGKEINLSNKDNLSYEDLHTEVFEDFVKGNGVGVRTTKRSLDLIMDIYEKSVQ